MDKNRLIEFHSRQCEYRKNIDVISVLSTHQGLENSWKRHQETIEHLWAGVEKMGLEMFVKDKVIMKVSFIYSVNGGK